MVCTCMCTSSHGSRVVVVRRPEVFRVALTLGRGGFMEGIVHILGGEALQQGGLAGVVQPQQHYPDLLLCGSLQFLKHGE
ncbi:hypothetical protein EYF80_024986 [Liparis tanakae]|uniref:Uncharacterized protein n=1 Tax=Liparis tanakae TaxID=230148 RepID=A0A4Z2HGQ9_9TELE|nr:hypothetical protein EYF80_024986 [Liparis tanakae]